MIAIVIPYYKSDFFETTLKSLSNQTNKNFKVYIGDDNSSDDPTTIIKKFENQISIQYKKFDTNMGAKSLPKQWQRCIELTNNEEWLIILGDDDVLGIKCIEKFYESLQEINRNNINVVKFATYIIDENDNIKSRKFEHPQIEKSTDFLYRKLKQETRSSISEYVFKMNIVKKYKFKNYPLAWHSDDFAFLQFSQFNNIFSINEEVVYFRYSNVNISGQKSINQYKKHKATFLFYADLVFKYFSKFNFNQKKIIFKYFILNSYFIVKFYLLKQLCKLLF
ncbi:Glyco_tranf_GTA_type domain containing protein [Flavobacteriaceae bacterium]